MPTDKDLKRLVRARMQKTGEAYTAARVQIVSRTATKSAPALSPAQPPDFAKLAGMSSAVISRKTGKDWTQWVQALDAHAAEKKSHRDIADLVHSEFGVPDWWTQAVTVGYERIKGIRAIGQRRDGTFEATKSKTFPVSIKKLFDACAKRTTRTKWLDEPGIAVRSATSGKSMRIKWSDDSVVLLNFLPKGKSKSVVAVQHTKLPDRSTAERLKKYWSERLDALAQALSV